MTEIAVREFPFVQDLPQREKSRLQILWDHFAQVREIVSEHGMLVPIPLAAELAGVSRQRIDELVEQGKLKRVQMHNRPFVTENSFVAWAKSERKDGRPLGAMDGTSKDVWRAAQRSLKKTSK